MTKFSWNRNAAHHRIAITRFVVVSAAIAAVVMLVSTGGTLPDVRTDETYQIAAVLSVAIFLMVFISIFLIVTAAYYALLQADRTDIKQEKPQPAPLKENLTPVLVGDDVVFHLDRGGVGE